MERTDDILRDFHTPEALAATAKARAAFSPNGGRCPFRGSDGASHAVERSAGLSVWAQLVFLAHAETKPGISLSVREISTLPDVYAGQLAFAPDGKTWAVGQQREISLFDGDKPIRTLTPVWVDSDADLHFWPMEKKLARRGRIYSLPDGKASCSLSLQTVLSMNVALKSTPRPFRQTLPSVLRGSNTIPVAAAESPDIAMRQPKSRHPLCLSSTPRADRRSLADRRRRLW